MAAATQARHLTQRGSHAADRPALPKILAGTKWYRGTVIVGHGDRMMAYPANGFNSPLTAAQGGPLQVPGADANGGLRLIAKEPHVRFVQTLVVGPQPIMVTVLDAGSTLDIDVLGEIGDTANEIVRAIQAHAMASSLVAVASTGTGLGAAVAFGPATAVPFVRLLGLACGDVDATADVADVDVANIFDYPYTVRRGVLGLELETATTALPGRKSVLDNQTITENFAPLLLPIFCDEIDNGLAFCRFE